MLSVTAEYLEGLRKEMKQTAMYDQILAETYMKYLISEDSKRTEGTYDRILKIFNSLVRHDEFALNSPFPQLIRGDPKKNVFFGIFNNTLTC